MNKKMKNVKKVIIGVMAVTMLVGTTGCGKFSSHFSRSSGYSEEKTITDSDGGTYQVVHKVETVNGDSTEFIEGAPCEIVNETGQAITGIYIVDSSEDNWGNNLLVANGESFTIEDGERRCGLTLSYDPNQTTFDVKIDKEDGKSAEFADCSLKGLEDPMHMEMKFTTNEDGSNQIHFE